MNNNDKQLFDRMAAVMRELDPGLGRCKTDLSTVEHALLKLSTYELGALERALVALQQAVVESVEDR